jgi:hypothetical protein
MLRRRLKSNEEAAPNRQAQIIDVGGGESTLVDDLLARRYHKLSLLDVSLTPLDMAKERLGEKASTWWVMAHYFVDEENNAN